MDTSAILWFALLVWFLLMESSTVALVCIWCAAGSLAALIASLCGAAFWLEIVIFFGVTIVTLCALRPVLRKFINPRIEKTNAEALVGTSGLVLNRIDNIQNIGTVKLSGMEWTARSTDGNPIEENTVITVDRIEGVKVFVSAK